MISLHRIVGYTALGLLLGLLAGSPVSAQTPNPCGANPCAANPCNPCGANPCVGNPCGANPCAANPCNPCGTNPCGGNPCGANPCGAGGAQDLSFVQPEGIKVAARPELSTRGKELWEDKSLSSNGLACATCHVQGSQLNATFAKNYPHKVGMPSQAGVDEVNAVEMVQFCMTRPMASKVLDWNSEDLAALTAYTLEQQAGFTPAAGSANPCGVNTCNPCGAKNPCNPCGAKKAANPCAN